MTIRFCHGCNAEVEFAQGACLLGHQPRAMTPDSPLAGIGAEVDRAFDEARFEVEDALRVESPVPAVVGAGVHGSQQIGVHAAEEAGVHGVTAYGASSPTVLEPTNVTTPRYLGPPLAPPPPPPPARREQAYQMINSDGRMPSNSDPITQFAPPPRVDWGPERVSLFGLGRLLRSRA